jgi:hypothetical protein
MHQAQIEPAKHFRNLSVAFGRKRVLSGFMAGADQAALV